MDEVLNSAMVNFPLRLYEICPVSDGAAAVVVGKASDAGGDVAFIWDATNGMVGLGDLAGGSFISRAWGVSADGTTVVGHSSSASGTKAFIWDAVNGMRELDAVLTAQGVDQSN